MRERAIYFFEFNKDALRDFTRRILPVLSLLVVMGVFWGLKLTGITMAGEAFCGMDEHVHTESCYEEGAECLLEEHVHLSSCYSNFEADIETRRDWEAALADVPQSGSTAERVAAVARSQLGYAESTLNFETDLEGVRRGITRYGQWYGNPYGDWSAMFASFCLHYAGAEGLPANAGAESMRLEWAAEELYIPAEVYSPQAGNLLFLRENAEAEKACAVAVIVGVTEEGIVLVQGNVADTVAEYTLAFDDPQILGYGIVPERSPFVMMSARASDMTFLAKTINYNAGIFTANRSFVIYTVNAGNYYAIDGSGGAVPVQIDGEGNILTDSSTPDNLLWSFTYSNGSYVIRNLGTGLHLHPFFNNYSDYGIITSGGWTTGLEAYGGGARLKASAYARLNNDTTAFEITTNSWEASVFQFGAVENTTVWFDGTNGSLMSLQGSDKTSYSVAVGSTVTLPSQWKTPDKYAYTLQGWYDVGGGKYYPAGAEVTVTGETLFYADWVAATYDIGQMNADVVDTVSTSEFITTHVFDYNSLFNTLSMNNNYSGGDSARWTLVESGNVQATGKETLNFIFVDYDDPGNPGAISYPIGRNQANGVDYTVITPGLYDKELTSLLFDPEREVVGKNYLGTGDRLFRYGSDPADTEHYGYYYYHAMLNAASYNQSNERFYVYDYLERTVDSASNDSWSDFLPLNSPYANTNGKATGVYYYNGVHNEYVGIPHIAYDTKYSDNSNSTNRIITNFWMGMSIEMDFYLPSVPGTVDSEGVLANKGINGKDMIFEFAGDDDVWVLIDGQLVLDIGGIHGVEAGSIDFSTGNVVVDGVLVGNVRNIAAGSHTLTMYYLERGSSMSNFKLRFNLSSRYSMTLRKEDTLTANLLNGAQFAVYTDAACTQPAELWVSRESHEKGDPAINIFTVLNGEADMWGFAAGNTYYMKEIRGPDTLGGVMTEGIIRLTLNNQGSPDYQVMPNEKGNLTVGFTVHGYKVNEDTQEAFLVVTNTDAGTSKPTEVYVEKKWDDTENHATDAITVYLLANGNRIQSVILSEATGWRHTWTNLPQTDAAGNKVVYTVREATVPGYVGKVERIDSSAADPGGSGSGGGVSVSGFADGKTYLLQTRFGYISASANVLQLIGSQAEAQTLGSAQWVAAVHNDGTVTLVNKAGHTLYYDNYTFKAAVSAGTYNRLGFSGGKLYCYIDHGNWSETQFMVDNDSVPNNLQYNNVFYTTNDSNQALTLTPVQLGVPEPTPPPTTSDGADFFRITNVPAGDATISLRVIKQWDLGGMGNKELYEELTVEMRLLANGEDAGLVGILALRNGWSYTFEDLPKYDTQGNEIIYTVEETDLPVEWQVKYGAVVPVWGSETEYETTVTNVYHPGVELPSTGGIGPYGYITLGALIILGALGWYCGQRRKCERRKC